MFRNFNAGAFFLLVISIVLLSRPIFAQQTQPSIQITSPSDGTIVTPGQTIIVKVTTVPGSNFSNGVGLVTEQPIQGNQTTITRPYQFSVTIPNNISAGKYAITAIGFSRSSQGVFSAPISVDVENTGNPTQLQAETPQLMFESIGEQLPIQILGGFPNGSTLPLNESSKISFVSANTAIATVNSTGMVTAVGLGDTTVTATYGNANPPIQATIPVNVPPQVFTLSPSILNFVSLPVGAVSAAQTVTLTSTKPINHIQVTMAGDFSETDNCSAVIPTTSCTINIKFTPTAPGNLSGTLTVDTEWNSSLINLSGIGTVVPFANFDPQLNIYDKSPFGFHLRGSFSLGTSSNGIDPQNEPVTLTIGAFSITIPAGSFKQDFSSSNNQGTGFISSNSGKFYFRGPLDNVDIEMKIVPEDLKSGKYNFEIKGTGVDITSIDNTPVVSLLIGDDMGTATIQPPHHSDSDKGEKGDDKNGGNHDQH